MEAERRGMLAHCPNEVLLDMIDNIMVRTRRYELGLMREQKNVSVATEDHDRIIAAPRKGDLDVACAALKRNMQGRREPVAAWLKSA